MNLNLHLKPVGRRLAHAGAEAHGNQHGAELSTSGRGQAELVHGVPAIRVCIHKLQCI